MEQEQLDRLTRNLLISPDVFRRRIEKQILNPAIHELRLELAPYHVWIMQMLAEEGNQSVNDVGEKLAISRSQMTFATDRLFDLGLITRKPDETDRRKVRIDLTLRGRWVTEELAKNIRKGFSRLLDDLSDQNLDQLEYGLQILGQLVNK
jgi:DNA-binding MarR family transcriptional regulator